MADDPIPRLLPALSSLVNWFTATQTPYLVIGGVAIALVGRARGTRDIDSVISIDETNLDEFVKSGTSFGFSLRMPNAVEFARASRVLLLSHQPSGISVDVAIGGIAFEHESILRGATVSARGIKVRVPLVEDLIIMKAVAGRPHDLADIDSLLDINPRVIRKRIRESVREFADLLDRPEIVESVEKLLTKKRVPLPRRKKPHRKS